MVLISKENLAQVIHEIESKKGFYHIKTTHNAIHLKRAGIHLILITHPSSKENIIDLDLKAHYDEIVSTPNGKRHHAIDLERDQIPILIEILVIIDKLKWEKMRVPQVNSKTSKKPLKEKIERLLRKPISCPICLKTILRNELVEHMKDNHPEKYEIYFT